MLFAQKLLLVRFYLALDCSEKGDELVLSLRQFIDNLLRVEDIEIVSLAIVDIVVVVLLMPPAGSLLFFS